MNDFEMLVISGADYGQFVRSFGSVCRALPPEVAKRLCAIQDACIVKYGFEGAYAKLNNRTVSQVIAEHQSVDAKPIASGEVDGVRYALYDAPFDATGDTECTDEL